MEVTQKEIIGTSESHPIYVNFIPKENLPNFEGTLGITFAPGKCHYGVISDIRWQRSLDKDIKTLKEKYNTTCLVTLIESFEFTNLNIEELRPKVYENGLNSVWFPIKDGDVPDLGNETLAIFDVFISYLCNLLKQGENIVVHCMGGRGRAGTISTCVLIKNGINYLEALETVRTSRKGAVENSKQESFIQKYEHYLVKKNLRIKY
jgi:protein-tyrosine phosphatase